MGHTYAVHRYSHWQGSRNPGERIAVLPDNEQANLLIDKLSTCSFCTPGRSQNYSVGCCYRAYRSRRDPTAQTADDALMQIRDAD